MAFTREPFPSGAFPSTELSPTTLGSLPPEDLLFIANTIAPMLKRDFLRFLPPEVALHILSFIDDPQTLARAAQVSKHWNQLLKDESIWLQMCINWDFDRGDEGSRALTSARPRSEIERTMSLEMEVDVYRHEDEPLEEMEQFAGLPMDPALEWVTNLLPHFPGPGENSPRSPHPAPFSYRAHFEYSHIICKRSDVSIALLHITTISLAMNWRHSPYLLRKHRFPSSIVATSLALDKDWIVIGLANSQVHVFSARTGVLARTLIGHDDGVWGVCLVSRGGSRINPPQRRRKDGLPQSGGLDHLLPPSQRAALGLGSQEAGDEDKFWEDEQQQDAGNEFEGRGWQDANDKGKKSSPCFSSDGWGQPQSLVVSAGCDKTVRVWDTSSGYCIYTLLGHTSTIRCIRVLHGRPIAVTGSRDCTIRVWDIQRGRLLWVLTGHANSVRCLDVCGSRVVSGSYDRTCRIWDVDTGACLHVLEGHLQEIYAVAIDGVRVVSGGLDTTVRVWDAETGICTAILTGHSALVCQLQLSPGILITGGSDGRIITFSLQTFKAVHRIAAHDSSVTGLQFDKCFLVSGGNDGRVRLFDMKTGNYIRDIGEGGEGVWKVSYVGATCVVVLKRNNRTTLEVWSMHPRNT
ncbi:WD40-repeat-containing domain protein [Infundibulicybe gibba]|nr:WD40-repeat-containing domain protein [Infundibulicybe gibba]